MVQGGGRIWLLPDPVTDHSHDKEVPHGRDSGEGCPFGA